MNRRLLLTFLVLFLGILFLACKDEAAPGDLDPDPAEEIPSAQGERITWVGGPGLETIHGHRVARMWGGSIWIHSGDTTRLYGSYHRTIYWELNIYGERVNEIMFYPVGSSEK